MSDSELREELDDKHERNRQHRLASIKYWVEYIKENPPDDWGRQQNQLINSQLQSARDSNLDAEHYQHVRDHSR